MANIIPQKAANGHPQNSDRNWYPASLANLEMVKS